MERMRVMMINMDPPRHSRLRTFVSRGFTPRMIGHLWDHITDICRDLLGDVAQRSEADFVADIAAPFADAGDLRAVRGQAGGPGPDVRAVQPPGRLRRPGVQRLAGRADASRGGDVRLCHRPAQQRRAQPRDDIVTRLLKPDDAGRVPTALEFNFFFLLLIVAGNETTRNAAAGGMLAFFDHPGQWQWPRLVADPSLAPFAGEEVVRWVSPAVLVRRTAVRDAELAGQRIAAGEKVVAFLASANRDEDVFTSPDEFDLGRDPNPHVGLGGGPHFCLGRHLAALELQVLLAALAEKTPGIRPGAKSAGCGPTS